jgi:hypothetical protein
MSEHLTLHVGLLVVLAAIAVTAAIVARPEQVLQRQRRCLS